MAFFKKKKAVVKVNINGRVMVDPAIHRRINPNYQVSVVRPKDHETGPEDDTTDDDDCYECSPAGESDDGSSASDEEPKYVTRLVKDKNGNVRMMKIPKEDADKGEGDKLDAVAPKDGESDAKVDTDGSEATEDAVADSTPIFSDEEYLISSPVVLGFAFSEKLWLEFTVSGIKEIQWNEGAYESLVLEPKTKDIVKVGYLWTCHRGMQLTRTGTGGIPQVSRGRKH
ncbi:hypothetical protein IMZ48_43995 [Candidatus Bathyarchaeota archaeon]|nr:hypothetical protein [Candidatus Bathyarchaeota archaeon]